MTIYDFWCLYWLQRVFIEQIVPRCCRHVLRRAIDHSWFPFLTFTMQFTTFTAAPTLAWPGPPVIYQTALTTPLVTATILAAPATVTAAAVAQRVKHDSNIRYPQPSGIAHQPSADTADALLADIHYLQQAGSADILPDSTRSSPTPRLRPMLLATLASP